jgi:hypothetical protein
MTHKKDINIEIFPVNSGKPYSILVAEVSLMMKRLKRMCGSGSDGSQKTSMVRVSTHGQSDGTSVSMLVKDTSRNDCFFQVRTLYVLRVISICDLITDPPSY